MRRLGWLLGLLFLAGVIVIALQFPEAADFVGVLQRAQPGWLLTAIVLQFGTYLAQAEIFQLVGRTASSRLAFADGLRISVAKQFVDQALPSAGISGTVFTAGALDA